MEARATGRAQDLANVPGAGARDVQGLNLFTLARPSPQCPLSTATLQAELGLGNWAPAPK